RRVLPDAVRVEAIDPVDRKINSVTDAVGAAVELHHAPQTQRSEGGIVEFRGGGHVADADARMIDHCSTPTEFVRRGCSDRNRGRGRTMRAAGVFWVAIMVLWRPSLCTPAGSLTGPDMRGASG